MRLVITIAALCLLCSSAQAAEYTIYPVLGATGDGYLRKSHAVLATACEGDNPIVSTGATSAFCGDQDTGVGGPYVVAKAYYHFDYGLIVPDNETITAATLYLYVVSKGGAALLGLEAHRILNFTPLDGNEWDIASQGLMGTIDYGDIVAPGYNTYDVMDDIPEDNFYVQMLTTGQCDLIAPGHNTDERVRMRTVEITGQTQDPYLLLTTVVSGRRTIPGAIVTHDGQMNPMVKVKAIR